MHSVHNYFVIHCLRSTFVFHLFVPNFRKSVLKIWNKRIQSIKLWWKYFIQALDQRERQKHLRMKAFADSYFVCHDIFDKYLLGWNGFFSWSRFKKWKIESLWAFRHSFIRNCLLWSFTHPIYCISSIGDGYYHWILINIDWCL